MRLWRILIVSILLALNAAALPKVEKSDGVWVSPSGKHAAYTIVTGYVDEPGLWEKGEKAPKTPTLDLAIYALSPDKLVRRIEFKNSFLSVTGWTPDGLLVYSGGSGFEVTEMYTYDPVKDLIKSYAFESQEESMAWSKLSKTVPRPKKKASKR